LRQTPSYAFTASPSDASERFQILLNRSTVGIENAQNETQSVSIYASGKAVYVRTTSENSHTLTLYNALGQAVYETQIFGKGLHTITPNLSKGLYFAKVAGGKNVKIEQFRID
jgi:hypothetical protein